MIRAYLDHVGVAVADLEASLQFFRDALGLHVEATEEVVSQRVRATFLPLGASSLELLEATAADSPIARFLESRGPGMHHLALRVDDIRAALAALDARGVRLIDRQPRPGAEGAEVAFIHPSARRAGRTQATGGARASISDGRADHPWSSRTRQPERRVHSSRRWSDVRCRPPHPLGIENCA